jgi:hypothetical protein
MARPLRIEFAGALYHVTSRGDGREAIYVQDQERHHPVALHAPNAAEAHPHPVGIEIRRAQPLGQSLSVSAFPLYVPG